MREKKSSQRVKTGQQLMNLWVLYSRLTIDDSRIKLTTDKDNRPNKVQNYSCVNKNFLFLLCKDV
jgi:hypothetical protein